MIGEAFSWEPESQISAKLGPTNDPASEVRKIDPAVREGSLLELPISLYSYIIIINDLPRTFSDKYQ